MTPAVTGVTGRLGGRISALLDAHGQVHLALVRDRAKFADLPHHPHAEPRGPAAYDDHAAMSRSLAGADTLLLISGHLSGRRLEEHSTAIDAAISVGVRRIIYVSLLGAAPDATYVNARDHAATESFLAGTGVDWTVLRPSYYPDMLLRYADRGVVRGPAGQGRCAFVGHDDIAEVAVEVLADRTGVYDGATLPITGPEALRVDEACHAAGLVFHDGAVPDGSPDAESWFRSIADGSVAEVSDVVPRLTGHEARSVAEVLAGQPGGDGAGSGSGTGSGVGSGSGTGG